MENTVASNGKQQPRTVQLSLSRLVEVHQTMECVKANPVSPSWALHADMLCALHTCLLPWNITPLSPCWLFWSQSFSIAKYNRVFWQPSPRTWLGLIFRHKEHILVKICGRRTEEEIRGGVGTGGSQDYDYPNIIILGNPHCIMTI